MSVSQNEDNSPLTSNFVLYDHNNPSSLFSDNEVEYIESIASDFSEADLEIIRGLEQFALNLNTGLFGDGGIPGLRKNAKKLQLYIERFPADSWQQFVDLFLRYVPSSFVDRKRCLVEMWRLKVPTGGLFYPFTFMGDLNEWNRVVVEAAKRCGTAIGCFEEGKFQISNGDCHAFSSLQWDGLGWKQEIPADW